MTVTPDHGEHFEQQLFASTLYMCYIVSSCVSCGLNQMYDFYELVAPYTFVQYQLILLAFSFFLFFFFFFCLTDKRDQKLRIEDFVLKCPVDFLLSLKNEFNEW